MEHKSYKKERVFIITKEMIEQASKIGNCIVYEDGTVKDFNSNYGKRGVAMILIDGNIVGKDKIKIIK